MRKIVLTLTLILCALFIGESSGARGGGPPDGHIDPLRFAWPNDCKGSDGKPTMGVSHLPYAAARPSAPSSLAPPAAPSATSFTGFVRCPAGDPDNPTCSNILKWKTAENATGYYRDPIFAATTQITDAIDGEQWGMTITPPFGEQFSFSPVTFTDTGDCFIFPTHKVCGATSIKIYWYFKSQCVRPGDWRADATHTGTVINSAAFTIKSQLGTEDEISDKLPLLADPYFLEAPYGGICHDAGERNIFPCSLGRPFQLPWRIEQLGSSLMSLDAVLSYHGVQSDPLTLNEWLLEHDYYDAAGNFDPMGPIFFAKRQGITLDLIGISDTNLGNSNADLDANICLYGPVSMRVLDNKHTVTATGMEDTRTTFTFLDNLDSNYKVLSDPPFDNKYYWYLVYSGPEHEFRDDQSGLTFNFHSPVEAFIVDPLGRRQGLDPRTGVRYNEIPGGFYGEFSMIGPEIPDGYEPPKMLDLRRPAEGTYTLSVVGTGHGTYDAEFRMYDRSLGRSQKEFVDVATAPGVVHTYRIEFSKAPGAQLLMTGGFDGGGQRPRDVNKFLSYAQLSATSTALPAGTTSYPLLVFFNQTILPATFHAQLNGADITSLFSPSPGSGQTVMLPLQRGRNVLQLSVDGSLPNRVATDTDRLVFDVP